MYNTTDFIKSDITFHGIQAGYFIEVENYFSSLTSRNKPKFHVFMACTHLGLKLTDKERRETVEAEKKMDQKLEEYEKSSYNIPRTVLIPEEMNIKRLLFLIATVSNKEDLNPADLQIVWNNPDISRTGAAAMYEYAVRGALYLLLQFQVNELNADQINELMFDIYSRDIGEIKLHQNTQADVDNLELNLDKIDGDVELDI